MADRWGNSYVTGWSNAGIGTNSDYMTLKYNPAGVQQWLQTYNGPNSGSDEALSETLDKFGNVYVTGFSSGYYYDYATIKYSSSGLQQWLQRYSGSGAGDDHAYDIAIDDSCNAYVTGNIVNINQNYQFATIKYNTNGAQQWLMTYPGGGKAICVDSLRNVYVTGTNNVSGTGVDIITIKYSQFTGISPITREIPYEFKLFQNYPNPFNPSTSIEFEIPLSRGVPAGRGVSVCLTIYDLLGREVATLVNQQLKPGTYEVEFPAPSGDGTNYSSGVYFYKLIAEYYSDTKKMILLK